MPMIAFGGSEDKQIKEITKLILKFFVHLLYLYGNLEKALRSY